MNKLKFWHISVKIKISTLEVQIYPKLKQPFSFSWFIPYLQEIKMLIHFRPYLHLCHYINKKRGLEDFVYSAGADSASETMYYPGQSR